MTLTVLIAILDICILAMIFYLWWKIRELQRLLRGNDLEEMEQRLVQVKELLKQFSSFHEAFETEFAEKKREINDFLSQIRKERERKPDTKKENIRDESPQTEPIEDPLPILQEIRKRKKKGLTEKQIAEELDISVSELRMYEKLHSI